MSMIAYCARCPAKLDWRTDQALCPACVEEVATAHERTRTAALKAKAARLAA